MWLFNQKLNAVENSKRRETHFRTAQALEQGGHVLLGFAVALWGWSEYPREKFAINAGYIYR